ncbi:MDR family MFS transporter [Falsibacillus pallidus]|uniref:Putative MFS family arabinose efflux permease n=1 Tax=Falsibacillus pallidus TaxID=493781 RepID=A0A370GQA8_9BACI|nr:MFS transporter [Falsibacillus pallidus]RDI45908.1 putative MFS family arabinose efflux permease [Falsibacillus pallidus]
MNSFKNLRGLDRNVWIRFAGEAMNGIAFMMLMPFLALYLKDKIDSLWLVGVVMAVGPVTSVVGTMLGGRLADQYGRKPVMIASMAGNGFVMLGFIYFDSFIAFVILSAFMGFLNSLFHPAASAMVADVTPPEQRTEAFGLLRLGHNIGAATGPLIGASIILVSKSIIFFITASSVFLYAIIVAVWIHESLPSSQSQQSGKTKQGGKKDSLPSPFKVLLDDKLLLAFILTGIVISMSFSQTEGMLPLHFDLELKHLTESQNPFPYLMAMNGLLVVLFQLPIASWAGKKKIGSVMLSGTIFFGLGMVALAWLPRYFYQHHSSFSVILIVLLIVYAVYTLGEMLMSPVQMTFISNIAPEHLRGTYMGASGLQWILGGAIGPLISGYLLDHSLGNALFTGLGIGCIIAGIIYLAIDRMSGERNQETANSKLA